MTNYIKQKLESEYNYIISDSRFIGEGWMSKAYLINEVDILRIAKSDYASEDLFKESELMPYVNKALKVETPRIKILDKQENGKYFMLYKAIKGEFIDDDEFFKLPVVKIDRFIDDLVMILDDLNAVELPDQLKSSYTIDIREEYIEEYHEYRENAYKHLSSETTMKLEKVLSEYLEDESNFCFEPKLIHADISFDHLVFDDHYTLKGLIDFGDLMLTDPDREYMYIFEEFGIEITKKIMELRGNKNIEHSLRKVYFYLVTDNLSLIDEGVKLNNTEYIENGIKLVEDNLESYFS
jgi:aminoglycoside 2''-phosphotransferase